MLRFGCDNRSKHGATAAWTRQGAARAPSAADGATRDLGGGSAVLRRDVSEARGERGNIPEAVGEMNARLRRRTFRDRKPRPPLCRRANGPRLEAAAVSIGVEK